MATNLKRSRVCRRLTIARSQWQQERSARRHYLRVLLQTPTYYRPKGTPFFKLGLPGWNLTPKKWDQVFP